MSLVHKFLKLSSPGGPRVQSKVPVARGEVEGGFPTKGPDCHELVYRGQQDLGVGPGRLFTSGELERVHYLWRPE